MNLKKKTALVVLPVRFSFGMPEIWRPRQESNPQPTDPKSGALSIELLGRDRDYTRFKVAVVFSFTIHA